MDFYDVRERRIKKDLVEVYPEFNVMKSKDLMVRGKSFYAVWNADLGMWSTDIYEVQKMIDRDLRNYKEEMTQRDTERVVVKYTRAYSSTSWVTFCNYIQRLSDNYHQLDEKLTFADTPIEKKDYISRRLPYSLVDGPHSAFDEIMTTLYNDDERQKILWAIGSVVSGDARKIQKFCVLYGDPGTGKGTVLDIIERLFADYCVSINAKDLASSSNQFATEIFRTNPLVCIDPDANLSRIEDNTVLNTVVSHEMMLMKEKFKPAYNGRANAFLFLGTNQPVKITDAKSGIIRRLIDISPSGRKIGKRHYLELMEQIDFELGAIAKYCLDIYKKMGRHYYDDYKPINMMFKTDSFFNFVDEYYFDFKREDGITKKNAYARYKQYCADSGLTQWPMYKFGEELKNYFNEFQDIARIDGKQVRSWYSGFKAEKFDRNQKPVMQEEEELPDWLILNKKQSLLDILLADFPAQYAVDYEEKKEVPEKAWSKVKTKLKDIDTSTIHYTLGPKELITVDFDLKDESGNKSKILNLKAAAKWPKTYAEFSKGGEGIHLEYFYDGDPGKLSALYSPGIEIKVFTGRSSLRRRLSYCNDIPVATISSGLPVKEEKVVNFDAVKDEQHLRNLIEKALRKEIEPGATKTCVDFMEKILGDAYNAGLHYDVSDMRPKIIAFANSSSHQPGYCLTRVSKMKFHSDEPSDSRLTNLKAEENDILNGEGGTGYADERLVFFDVEVFPNLCLVNWKFAGDTPVQRMINPKPMDIEYLMRMKLVGFNCRRYDNHILYAIYIGKKVEEIYDISQRIINGSRNAMFGEAYNLSYTDVYDFCSKKQSLKKWEIELGFHHQELGLPWDKPVPEEMWEKVAEYCDNDVLATEAVFNNRQADWTARQILADIAGMTVNDTTNSLTTKIIFGDDKNPQAQFNYRHMGDVSQIDETKHPDGYDAYTAFDSNGRPIFPGYLYQNGQSLYRGEDVGIGGYVYAEPGVYREVALLDIASMHPSSVVAENLFGDTYTKRFKDILQARIYIKHKEYAKAGELFDGKLKGYLKDESLAKALAGALKIAINSVYGLTSAGFANPFKDIRNIDNIVAKRGALFMVNLKHEVQKRGFKVAHIKTDSIKIPDATTDIINFVMEYGKMYGYNFEHEATYDRMCLVNDAVYIARYSKDSYNEHPGEWTATGTQFQVPYVFKTLFSKEPIEFSDLCETKTVTSALYLDMNEDLPDVSDKEKELQKYEKRLKDIPDDDPNREDVIAKVLGLNNEIAKGHNYIFVGKAGLFCPIKSGFGGGLLMREKDGKYYAAGGTKGYRWKESEVVESLGLQEQIDRGYFDHLVDEAKVAIEQYEDFEKFTADITDPWDPPCGEDIGCEDCPYYNVHVKPEGNFGPFICGKGFEVI